MRPRYRRTVIRTLIELDGALQDPGVAVESPTDRGQFRTLGRDAVEVLAVQVHLPGRAGDPPVEAIQAAQGLGVGILEVDVAVVLALDLRQALHRFGQLGADAGSSGPARASNASRNGPTRSPAAACLGS